MWEKFRAGYKYIILMALLLGSNDFNLFRKETVLNGIFLGSD
jgi:hypothetical protein